MERAKTLQIGSYMIVKPFYFLLLSLVIFSACSTVSKPMAQVSATPKDLQSEAIEIGKHINSLMAAKCPDGFYVAMGGSLLRGPLKEHVVAHAFELSVSERFAGYEWAGVLDTNTEGFEMFKRGKWYLRLSDRQVKDVVEVSLLRSVAPKCPSQ